MSANRPPPSSPLGDPLCLGDLQHDSQKVVTDSPTPFLHSVIALSILWKDSHFAVGWADVCNAEVSY